MKHSATRRRWAAIAILASLMTMAGSACIWSVATANAAVHATVHQVADGDGNSLLGPPWG